MIRNIIKHILIYAFNIVHSILFFVVMFRTNCIFNNIIRWRLHKQSDIHLCSLVGVLHNSPIALGAQWYYSIYKFILHDLPVLSWASLPERPNRDYCTRWQKYLSFVFLCIDWSLCRRLFCHQQIWYELSINKWR